jgi:hypothetical protein
MEVRLLKVRSPADTSCKYKYQKIIPNKPKQSAFTSLEHIKYAGSLTKKKILNDVKIERITRKNNTLGPYIAICILIFWCSGFTKIASKTFDPSSG